MAATLRDWNRQFFIPPQTAHKAGHSKNRHLLFYGLAQIFGRAGAKRGLTGGGAYLAAKNSRNAAVVSTGASSDR
jgi:hypothetical protein